MQRRTEFVGTLSLTSKETTGYERKENMTLLTILVQGWKYGDSGHNSAGKLRAVRFAASQIGDESLKCPLPKTPAPLTTTEKMIRKGKWNRQDMATFTITVFYTKALGYENPNDIQF